MIILLSPAKNLNEAPLDSTNQAISCSAPLFTDQTHALLAWIKKKSVKSLMDHMNLSEKLAELNHRRYQDFDAQPSKPALFLFNGDVYDGLEALSLCKDSLIRAQSQLRILSGLYGLLRPYDLIRPYRLEMGRPIAMGRTKTLPNYWAEYINKALLADCDGDFSNRPIINLASKEYAQSVTIHKNAPSMVTLRFLDTKGNEAKTISFFAKKARGKMARLILETGPIKADDIKELKPLGYSYDSQASSSEDWVFSRIQPR
jgi:cytoplasmic iron level regulating protein YaaA (DUF328/UPF0246 family)